MAEGGSPNDNPFSFQKFMKKKDDRSDERPKTGKEEVADIFDLPNTPSVSHENSIHDDNEDSKPRNKGDKKEKNPFSFKKFLAGGGARPKTKGGPDVACDLPDFITGNINEDPSSPSRVQKDGDLPDFALCSSPDIQQTTQPHFEPPSSKIKLDNDGHVNNSDIAFVQHINGHTNGDGQDTPVKEEVVDDWAMVTGPHLVSSLPDFLSDAASVVVDDDVNDKLTNQNFLHIRDVNCNSSEDIEAVRKENRDLRQELDQSRHENSSLSKRLAQMTKDLEQMQTHEAEETKALENMVQQVEANLVTTTQRAVHAESTITKLKQEIRSLQNQLSVITIENEDLRCGNTTISSIKERTQYASKTLATAASTAEKQLKDMLSGVESLKMLADVLASVDKVCDHLIFWHYHFRRDMLSGVESLKMLADVLASVDKVRDPSPGPSTSAGAQGGPP